MRDFHLPNRSASVAGSAMAATSHPLATLAAVETLRGGGNAVDAAVAAAAVLAVAEPHMTGLGGDCFAIYAPKGKAPIALNGSGRAPMRATLDWYIAHNIHVIEAESPHAVTVPGAVDAWLTLNADHGTRDMAALLAPAITLAEEGCVVTPRVAYDFAWDGTRAMRDPAAARIYAPQGRILGAGERMRNPALAETLRHIARDGRKGFYEGPVAADIIARLNQAGGLHTLEDFALQRAEYVPPITAPYRGFDVYECPPNGQGVAALMILRVLEGYALAGERFGPADRIHLLAEATKAAYYARDALIGDPRAVAVPVAQLLSDARAQRVRDAIRLDRAGDPPFWDEAEHKDTVYLCVVDRDGNAISFINSLFDEFGCGIMAPETGVMLHSRGKMFRIEPGHPNAIAPGKRPLHTIIPALLMKDGRPVMPFGVMGGNYQAVGHAHLLSQMLDRGLDPQAALETPRSFAFAGVLQLEPIIPRPVAEDLARRGHVIAVTAKPLGGGQAIWIDRDKGVLVGGSDPRKDGCALGF
ncbi:MAG TPA: gamma-glutamyltransferase [Stellaceae bacterium]|nr:gamma-glutamyltransferase [Stellaceae bacterium]